LQTPPPTDLWLSNGQQKGNSAPLQPLLWAPNIQPAPLHP